MHPNAISIRNHSGKPQAYYLLADPPTLLAGSAPSPAAQKWRIVYQASLLLPDPHGSTVFPVKPAVLAVCGTAKEKIQPGVVLYPSDWLEVALATKDAKGDHAAVTMPRDGDAAFERAKVRPGQVEPEGAFAIAIDGSFRWPHPKCPFVGLGALDPHRPDNVVPVAVYDAEPSSTYCLVPSLRYFVVAGMAEAGQVVDVSDLTMSGVIDFANGSTASWEVVHLNDGTFTVDEA